MTSKTFYFIVILNSESSHWSIRISFLTFYLYFSSTVLSRLNVVPLYAINAGLSVIVWPLFKFIMYQKHIMYTK